MEFGENVAENFRVIKVPLTLLAVAVSANHKS